MYLRVPVNPSVIEQLLEQSSNLWRGKQSHRAPSLSTGFAALDAALPNGGWPLGALIEFVPALSGIGELTLPLPALQSIARQNQPIALVAPPYVPYAPALRRAGLPLEQLLWIAENDDADSHWAAEQLLREGAGAVLLWSNSQEDRAMRRLQLAAEARRALAIVYRPITCLQQASSAALRIALRPSGTHLSIEIVKVRRGVPTVVTLDLPWSVRST